MNHKPKKSGKIFVLSFWIGLLSIPVLIIIFNIIVDPYEYFNFIRIKGFNAIKPQVTHQVRLVKNHQICRQQPANIIVGSSRVELAFDPDSSVWDPFPGKTYNMGMAGIGIGELYKTIVHAHCASKNLKLVVVALDFFMFNAHREAVVFGTEVIDFDDRRLLKCSSDTCLKSLIYDVDFFLGKKATLASYKTIRGQDGTDLGKRIAWLASDPGKLDLYLYNGLRDPINSAVKTATDAWGARTVFAMNGAQEKYYLEKIWRAGPEKRYCFSFQSSNSLDVFRKIISFANKNNIDLRLLIAPEHARMLLAIKEAGLWVQFEAWKREMVRIINEEAHAYKTKPVALWDFSGFNAITTESAPPEGFNIQTQWYWEPSHYKLKAGEHMLNKIFNDPKDTKGDMHDFGIQLNKKMLDAHLKSTRDKMIIYENTHLEESRIVKTVVHEVLKDSNGSNCGHDFEQLVKANESIQKGETETANAYFKSALRIHQIERARAEKIGVPFKENGFIAALKLVKHGGILEKKPSDWIGYQDRGNAKKERGNLKGAIEDYSKAIETGPVNTALYYLRGIAYADLKDHTHAMDDFKAGLKLDPNNVTLKFLLKQSSELQLKALANVPPQHALGKQNAVIQKDSLGWIQYQDRGKARKERGNLKGAIEDYSKAIETGPPNTALYYLRGITYAELKDHVHAIDDFQAGLKLDPSNITLKFLLKQSSKSL